MEPATLVRLELLDRDRAVADRAMAQFELTSREADVALHLAAGRTDRDIAETLGISWHTVRTHVERVLAKMGVDSRGKVGPLLAAEV